VSGELGGPIGQPVERPAPGGGGERAAPPLRLGVARDDLPRLQHHPLVATLATGRPVRHALHHVYYDTAELDLGRAGLALRMRRAGRHHVQTLEVPGAAPGPFGLGHVELDAVAVSEAPDLDAVPDLALRDRLHALAGGKALLPVFEVELARTRRLLREDHHELRFDLEVGELRGAFGSMPVCELELGLRTGDPAYPWRLALELLDSVRLRPAARSLAERGYERAAGRGPATRKAEPLELAVHSTVDALLSAVTSACLRHLVANQAAALEGVDPEGVHQMRVAARRMRSALAFFAPVVPERQRTALRDPLRWLAEELGPARDLDVFTLELLGPLAAARPDDTGLARLLETAQARRADAQARAREALRSPRYPRLVLELGAWLARRSWREQPLSETSAALFGAARPFTADRLERRHRKARRLGRRLAQATPEERHRLRIRLKKLRYAAEFSAPLHPGRRAERYARRLARLQDTLGHLNDVVLAEARLAELVRSAPREAAEAAELRGAAGFVSGWLAHSAQRAVEDLPRRWQRFEKAGRFWEQPQTLNPARTQP
jgi:inorganic triphosphatase YgiF